MFLFLSLALSKRCAELLEVRRLSRHRAHGRDYRVEDLAVVAALGMSCGSIAVLVLALYINSPGVGALYQNPYTIWSLCPMLLYWIGRVWLKTWRGEMHEDPVLFAVRDRASRLILVAALAILALAS
jgi:hypothetical protein